MFAGRFGKRLTDDRLEPMIEVSGVPILEWQIGWLIFPIRIAVPFSPEGEHHMRTRRLFLTILNANRFLREKIVRALRQDPDSTEASKSKSTSRKMEFQKAEGQ